MNNEQRVERARQVRLWLESDEWRVAWESYREVLIETIESAADDEQALEARRMLRAAKTARNHLEQLILDGALAAADIAARKSRLKLT